MCFCPQECNVYVDRKCPLTYSWHSKTLTIQADVASKPRPQNMHTNCVNLPRQVHFSGMLLVHAVAVKLAICFCCCRPSNSSTFLFFLTDSASSPPQLPLVRLMRSPRTQTLSAPCGLSDTCSSSSTTSLPDTTGNGLRTLLISPHHLSPNRRYHSTVILSPSSKLICCFQPSCRNFVASTAYR